MRGPPEAFFKLQHVKLFIINSFFCILYYYITTNSNKFFKKNVFMILINLFLFFFFEKIRGKIINLLQLCISLWWTYVYPYSCKSLLFVLFLNKQSSPKREHMFFEKPCLKNGKPMHNSSSRWHDCCSLYILQKSDACDTISWNYWWAVCKIRRTFYLQMNSKCKIYKLRSSAF